MYADDNPALTLPNRHRGTPPNALLVARSESHQGHFGAVPEDLLSHLATVTGERPKDLIRAEIAKTTAPARGAVASDPLREGAREMADNPIILLHPVREPLDQTAVGALELLARMMLPMDTAERTLFWKGS